MNIVIYYGGRGIIDDPTLTVITRLQKVLEELRVNVTRYNLYEHKNNIPTLPQTLNDADGIILAATVEWHGIGGYMAQFLDACWQFGNKEKIAGIYMMPVVMSRTYGEREAKLDLDVAWEILGGKPCSGICGYIENTVDLELNDTYGEIIEKKAENLYRIVNQKANCFPASNKAVKQKVAVPQNVSFTPEESAQLSQYISDDTYVRRQKEDIQELASLFRNQMEESEPKDSEEYLAELKKAFTAQAGVAGSYQIKIENKKENLIIRVAGATMSCSYGNIDKPDVEMDITRACMEDIINGRMTFQRAFMSGAMKMKGEFKILCGLDQVFHF